MKRNLNLLLSALFVMGLSSCNNYKQVAYLQNSHILADIRQDSTLYDARIMPKDLLTITVNSENPEATAPYNLVIQSPFSFTTKNVSSQPALMNYLVDNDGNIDFPTLGILHVGGLTKNEVEELIHSRLSPYLKGHFIVNVRMANYKISVIGEVARPNTYTISNEKVNIFEALALAGDLTIYGKRDAVKLIREDSSGQKQIVTLNLNDAHIVTSPYYYLRQNDIVYVEPNKTKARNSDIGNSTTLWFSATSIMVSLTSLLYNILN